LGGRGDECILWLSFAQHKSVLFSFQDAAVEAIKNAGNPITFVVQSLQPVSCPVSKPVDPFFQDRMNRIVLCLSEHDCYSFVA
jgi:hypothetical protein